jgi:4-amino-4-deoxy-L-arabinose transferase-like glycosyltransferase
VSKQRMRRRWVLLGAVILLGAMLRFWQLGDLALIGDESYFWLWSRHLDWAYFDHPAGIAVVTWLSTALGGQSEVGIRWLNALLGVACIVLTYRLGKGLFNERAGLIAAVGVAVGAPYLLTARFVYTDALHLSLLLLNLYLFWHLAQERPRPQPATTIAFGLSLALLFNTKYSAYLYALALGVAIVIDHRRLLVERRFWLAVGIAALGLVPVVVWNAAHDWASFRWQLSHAGLDLTGGYSLLGSLYHSLVYLTWPLVVLALLGLGLVRRPAERLLTLVALLLLLPVALSRANSPRNLSTGLVLLFVLAGARWSATPRRRWQTWLAALLAVMVGLGAIYGLGTVASLGGASAWPHSSIVPDIHRDAAGWRELGPALAGYPQPIFALDYSIASQIWYYAGGPAYTSWEQYRLWGIPPFQHASIVALDYLDEALVTERLEIAFASVAGPQSLRYEEQGAEKVVHIWQTEGLQVDQSTFLDQFDFLHLLEAASDTGGRP